MATKSRTRRREEQDGELTSSQLFATSNSSTSVADNHITSDNECSQILPPAQSDINKAVIQAIKTPEFAQALALALTSPETKSNFLDLFNPAINSKIDGALEPVIERLDAIELSNSLNSGELFDKIDQLDKAKKKLQDKVLDLERQSRALNVRVSGLTPPNGSSDEQIIDHLCGQLSVANFSDINKSDILSVTKILTPGPTSGPNQPSTYLFRLISEKSKLNILTQRKKLKTANNKLFINEDLTKEHALIYKHTRDQVKNGKLFATWVKNGQIWAKTSEKGKPFIAKNIDEL